MPKLTDSSIKAAKCSPDKDRLELSDAACPGLILRVTKAGSKTFSFKYWSPRGKTVALTLGSYPDLELAAARSKVADHRKTIAADEDPRRLQREERKKVARAQKVLFPSKFDETSSTSIARASISQALNGKKNGKKTTARPRIALGSESSWAWRTSQPKICAGPRRRLLDALALHGPTSRRCSTIFRAT